MSETKPKVDATAAPAQGVEPHIALSLAGLTMPRSPEVEELRSIVTAEPNAIPELNVGTRLHIDAVLELAREKTGSVPADLRAALKCPSAPLRRAA